MKIVYKIFNFLVVLVLLGLCVFALKRDYFLRKEKVKINTKPKAPLVRVVTRPVGLMSNDRTFEAVGTGKAQKSVWIYPAISEQVVGIHFKAGQRVSQGQILVQLDNREEQLAIQLAEIELQNAKTLLARYEKSVHSGAVSQNQLDSARLALDANKVKLNQAKLAWKKRKIVVPFDGIVGISRVHSGDRINTNTIITSLDDRSAIHIDFDVPEILAGSLHKQLKMEITTPVFPQKTFVGTVYAIASRFKLQTRTVRIRAEVVNKKDLLRPGMSFAVKLHIKGKKYPTVPEIALKWGREGSYVWIVKNQKAQKIMARVVARTDQKVLVDASIQKGDLIVIEGTQRLRNGRKVVTDESLKDSNA